MVLVGYGDRYGCGYGDGYDDGYVGGYGEYDDVCWICGDYMVVNMMEDTVVDMVVNM